MNCEQNPGQEGWEITPADTKRLLDQDAILLLDCRSDPERRMARIEPSVFIPMDELAQRFDELSPHVEREVVVYCRSGGRSLLVTAALRQAGFHARSMAGGIHRWAEEIDPSLPPS